MIVIENRIRSESPGEDQVADVYPTQGVKAGFFEGVAGKPWKRQVSKDFPM